MKAILKFDLSDEDDMYDFSLIQLNKGMVAVIHNYSNILRSANKYGMDERIKTSSDAAEYLREQFHELLNEHHVSELI